MPDHYRHYTERTPEHDGAYSFAEDHSGNVWIGVQPIPESEVKIFDPRDATTGSPGAELLDATVFQRDRQWRMYLAGQPRGFGPTDIFSASLPVEAPLSMAGWLPVRETTGELMPVARRQRSAAWDGNGGRHCPSYVKGWDPAKERWVERIYYAGAADNLWGPYTIGFLEWDGNEPRSHSFSVAENGRFWLIQPTLLA